MIRIGLECAFVFLLPSLLYFGYRYLVGEMVHAETGKAKPPAVLVQEAPLGWLFVAGCALLVVTLLAFATLQEKGIDKPYVPAVYKDGQIK